MKRGRVVVFMVLFFGVSQAFAAARTSSTPPTPPTPSTTTQDPPLGVSAAPAAQESANASLPVWGLGISNHMNLLMAQLGVAGVLPFTTLTGKYFINKNMAAQADLGMSVMAPNGGPNFSRFLLGGKFHYILAHFKNSHVFANAGMHMLFGGGPGLFGFNLGFNAGWEYIFKSGIPGLGISPEFGMNISYINPKGPKNDAVAFSLNGAGDAFPFVLMNIRYYFF